MNSARKNFGLRYLGSLSGRGRLWAADEALGEGEYSIEVSEDAGGERYAYGTLWAPAGVLISMAGTQGEIKLECGKRLVSITLLQTSKTLAYFELVDKLARAEVH